MKYIIVELSGINESFVRNWKEDDVLSISDNMDMDTLLSKISGQMKNYGLNKEQYDNNVKFTLRDNGIIFWDYLDGKYCAVNTDCICNPKKENIIFDQVKQILRDKKIDFLIDSKWT